MKIKRVTKQVRENLGKTIREKRHKLNVSQAELSKKAHITRTYLSLIENGKRFPSWEVLEKISNLLFTTLSDIIEKADLIKYDKKFELVHSLSKIIESGNKQKIQQAANLINSLS